MEKRIREMLELEIRRSERKRVIKDVLEYLDFERGRNDNAWRILSKIERELVRMAKWKG